MSFPRHKLYEAYSQVKNMSPRDPEYVSALETTLDLFHHFYQWTLAVELERSQIPDFHEYANFEPVKNEENHA